MFKEEPTQQAHATTFRRSLTGTWDLGSHDSPWVDEVAQPTGALATWFWIWNVCRVPGCGACVHGPHQQAWIHVQVTQGGHAHRCCVLPQVEEGIHGTPG
jgi:hypothetical protein